MAAERAAQPEDLSRLFVERANAGDLDGLGGPLRAWRGALHRHLHPD